jgi:hypothetical protein
MRHNRREERRGLEIARLENGPKLMTLMTNKIHQDLQWLRRRKGGDRERAMKMMRSRHEEEEEEKKRLLLLLAV